MWEDHRLYLFIATVGSSTDILGSGSVLSLEQIVSPIVTSAIPATKALAELEQSFLFLPVVLLVTVMISLQIQKELALLIHFLQDMKNTEVIFQSAILAHLFQTEQGLQ